jgi:hypothetical protein
MAPEAYYTVQRLDDTGKGWEPLPGGEADQSWKAIRMATVSFEKTGIETRVVNQRGAEIWNAMIDLPQIPE